MLPLPLGIQHMLYVVNRVPPHVRAALDDAEIAHAAVPGVLGAAAVEGARTRVSGRCMHARKHSFIHSFMCVCVK